MSSARTGLGDPGNRYSRATSFLNPIKRSVNKRRKHNGAIAAPCPTTAPERGLADYSHCTAVQVNYG